jgi:hypothetical protein
LFAHRRLRFLVKKRPFSPFSPFVRRDALLIIVIGRKERERRRRRQFFARLSIFAARFFAKNRKNARLFAFSLAYRAAKKPSELGLRRTRSVF